MPNYFKQVAVAVLAVAICISGIACGGGSNPHPCQGATCAPSASEFLYATALDDISGFSIATGGSPTSLQNQAGPNQSIGIVVGPSAKFLYVSDFENAGVEAFTINRTTGVLARVAGSPFSAGSPPGAGGIAVDPNTKFLYITLMNSAAVAGFSINSTTGGLTPIGGSPFSAGNTPVQAIVDLSGKFLYVSNMNDSQGSISAYNIDPTSGVLTPIAGSPFATQTNFPGPAGLEIAGGGNFLYVAMVGTANPNNAISGFSIDPTTGVLTQLANSPFAAGQGPLGLAKDSGGKFLFATNSFDDTVSVFTVDANTGNLGSVAGSPFPSHSFPVSVTVNSDDRFVYVANSTSADLSVFSLNVASGALSPVAGSPFSTGQKDLGGLAIVKTH